MKVDNSLEGSTVDDTLPELKFPISSVEAANTLLISKYGKDILWILFLTPILVLAYFLFVKGVFKWWLFGFFWILLINYLQYRFKTIYRMVEKRFFEQFAEANGYSYLQKSNELPLTGALFLPSAQNFLSQKNGWLEHVISGEFKGKKVRMYSFCQPGRNDSVMKRTVFEVDYDTPLPKMLLKPDWHMTYVKPIFKKEHHLSLEGDFDQHFDLYVEKDFEMEALQIFTPDIMHRLQTDWRRFVIEFSHDSIFIYTMTVLSKKKDLEHIYSCAKYLIEKLSPVSQRMESGLVAMQQRFKH